MARKAKKYLDARYSAGTAPQVHRSPQFSNGAPKRQQSLNLL